MFNRIALLIIATFAILAFAMSIVVPPFETPDEPYHYAFARHIADGNWLPVQEPEQEQPWSHEGSQAPLYYLLTGALTSFVDQSDYPELAVRNPRANMGNPMLAGNKNFMLYSGTDHPLQGANLALHLGRWFSILLAIVTLWFTWLTAQLALPSSPRLQIATLLLVAVIPQFVYVSASFSNDNMVIVLGAVTAYFIARTVDRYSNGNTISTEQWIALGTLLGLAALSKLSGLGLCILSAVSVWGVAIYHRDWWLPWRALLPIAIPFLLVAGWWYWRNFTLYGDWLGANYLLEINGRRSDQLTWPSFWAEFRGLRYSFWGLFGWFNVPLPGWVYQVFDAFTAMALLGLGGWVLSHFWTKPKADLETQAINQPVIFVLAAWAVIPLALIIYWAQQATSSQGRLLFPAIGALALFFVLGLEFWVNLLAAGMPKNRQTRWIVHAAVPAFALACTVYTLTALIPNAYAAPRPVADLPADATSLHIRYGDGELTQTAFTLLGILHGHGEAPADERYKIGDRVPITLFWRAEEKPQLDHQIFVQLLDENNNVIANTTTHPGWGRNPTSFWQAGAIYPDHYELLIKGPVDNLAPLLAQIYTGFIDPATDQDERKPLTARNEADEVIQPMPAQIVVLPTKPLTLDEQPSMVKVNPPTVYGDGIELIGYEVPQVVEPFAEQIDVSLLWRSRAALGDNFVAYVHLIDEAGNRIAGFDQPPAASRFPTSYWRTGDSILSKFEISLPTERMPTEVTIWVGLYKEGSGGTERLPVTATGNLETAHNQVHLGKITYLNKR